MIHSKILDFHFMSSISACRYCVMHHCICCKPLQLKTAFFFCFIWESTMTGVCNPAKMQIVTSYAIVTNSFQCKCLLRRLHQCCKAAAKPNFCQATYRQVHIAQVSHMTWIGHSAGMQMQISWKLKCHMGMRVSATRLATELMHMLHNSAESVVMQMQNSCACIDGRCCLSSSL